MLRMVHHICMDTHCYSDSLSFYCEILGFRIVKEEAALYGRSFNTWLKRGDILIELQSLKKKPFWGKFRSILLQNPHKSGINHVCFIVDSIEKEINRIQKKGYSQFKQKDDAIVYLLGRQKHCKIVAPEGTVIEFREQDLCF